MPELTGNLLWDLLGVIPKPQKEEEFNPFSEAPESSASNEQPKRGGFNILNSLGSITGYGSSLWGPGLDVDLKMGDIVPSAYSGIVDFVGPRGGFGNQVRIKGDDGRDYWYSHLMNPQVQQGQRIGAGSPIGLGGNTGNVIPGPGGDGSHLDFTVQEKGQYLDPRMIAELLRSYA